MLAQMQSFMLAAGLLATTFLTASAHEPCASPSPAPALQTDTRESTGDKPSEIISRLIVPDFAEITPTLYRGAQPRKDGFEALAKMGVQIVVDLRGDRESERRTVTSLGMQYIPMYWECSFPKDRVFAKFLILLRKNPGKKVFVHCKVGDDRTGMMIAAYRMAEQGWTARRAMREMRKYGFSFLHRRIICLGLSEYEKHFPQRFATRPEFAELRSAKRP